MFNFLHYVILAGVVYCYIKVANKYWLDPLLWGIYAIAGFFTGFIILLVYVMTVHPLLQEYLGGTVSTCFFIPIDYLCYLASSYLFYKLLVKKLYTSRIKRAIEYKRRIENESSGTANKDQDQS